MRLEEGQGRIVDDVLLTSTEMRSLGTPLSRRLVAHFVNMLADAGLVGEAEMSKVGTAVKTRSIDGEGT